MIEEFNKYVIDNHDIESDGIKRKYNHSIRVMELSIKYAKLLNFSEEDIELASIIGLLHDIGRFDQFQKYQNYNDQETFDHADYGVKILFEDNLIKKFTNRVNDYDLIKFAIKNHNKLKIEKTSNKRYLKFTNLIRDVDKLDIIYLLGYLNEVNISICNEKISTEVINEIKNHQNVDKKYAINKNDEAAMKFSFAFDINNDIVLKELKRYYYYYYKVVNNNGIFTKIYNEVVNYINERTEQYAR